MMNENAKSSRSRPTTSLGRICSRRKWLMVRPTMLMEPPRRKMSLEQPWFERL